MNRWLSILLIFLAILSAARIASAQDREQLIAALRAQFEENRQIHALLERDPDVRQRFDTWLDAAAKRQLDAVAEESPANPELRQELLDRMKRDQEVRKGADRAEWANVDEENRTWLKTVIDRGWPGKSLVGTDGAHAAWILAQHADRDRTLQKRCLKLMQEAAEGEVALPDIAYLVDRVREGDGRPQLYGTQLRTADGKLVLKEVEAPSSLNDRRDEMGVMPIEVYLLFANDALSEQQSPSLAPPSLSGAK